jgi:glycosyltransferase involved in cell wall biosynthesis
MRIGTLVSHPIQYYAPLFRELAQRVDLHVFYATRGSREQQAGAGFGVEFEWDIDLLSGYDHVFLNNVSRQPGTNSFFGCDTPEIAGIIARERFDAFIVFGWYLRSHWQAVRACKRYKVPVLVRGDSQLHTPRSMFKKWVKHGSHRLALRQFDGFLSVGKRNREYLLHYGAPADRIFASPHFVDNEWFATNAEEVRNQRSEIRGRWGISKDALCVLFCGKFIPKKRPMDLVTAAQLLVTNKQLSNIHLLFAGSGELGGELRANCNVVFDQERSDQTSDLRPPTSGTKPSASFAGFLNQSEIPKAYVAADVLVLPSDGSETWGLVVNEAMACGLPAIVSDAVGCGPDMIDEGQTGFTFPFADTEALADCVMKSVQLHRAGTGLPSSLKKKLVRYSAGAAVDGVVRAGDALKNQPWAGR